MIPESIDLLMIFPSGGDIYQTNFNHHLGTAYIIGYVRKHGFKAKQFLSNTQYNVRECVKSIFQYNPKVIGFTVYESNYMQSVLLSTFIKKEKPNIIIIFGGPTPTIHSEYLLKQVNSIDLCVRQEGEETVLEILKELQSVNYTISRANFTEIKGIIYRIKDQIFKNPDSDYLYSKRHIRNYIDKYPSPYLSEIIPKSKAFPIGILTGRGCNQSCTYCNCAVLSKKNIYFHSIGRVIEELEFISQQEKFSHPIPIYDDAFTIIPSRAKKICETIIEKDIKIPLLCITRCDKLNEELLDLMKMAGFKSIGFSLESAVPRVLRAIGKVRPVDVGDPLDFDKEVEYIEKLKHMTKYAKEIGMFPVFLSIMIGLPGESLKDAQKTLEMIKQLEIDYYTHNLLHIFKGTPLFQDHGKYGYKITPMGKNNQVFTINNYPFDITKIHLADNSTKERNSKVMDYDVFNIISLRYIQKDSESLFFKNIIIDKDIIEPSLVKWMQDILAINGIIIHLYSSKKNYLKFHEKNEMTLYNEYSPTKTYECYYWENLDRSQRLKSGRLLTYGEKVGLNIEVKSTGLALEEYNKGYNTDCFIGASRTKNDSDSLYKLFQEISNAENSFNYLLDNNALPHFQNLCRWIKNQANCEKLETVIVDKNNSIRFCWHSSPVGKVGMRFSEIKRKINDLKKQVIKIRGCYQCSQEQSCQLCLSPFPLSSKEYCEYKISQDTNTPANLINVFYVIKDLFYKPINPYDF
ncbi:MAG: B12-binding domain-containing radical SAM protein [Promethearchaeota archaeon]